MVGIKYKKEIKLKQLTTVKNIIQRSESSINLISWENARMSHIINAKRQKVRHFNVNKALFKGNRFSCLFGILILH